MFKKMCNGTGKKKLIENAHLKETKETVSLSLMICQWLLTVCEGPVF